MIAGYARRMVPESLKGRAMAVAMVGTPLALALGVPAGTLLGTLVGWRSIFGILSLLALMLIAWVFWKLPDYPGEAPDKRLPLYKVFVIPGYGRYCLLFWHGYWHTTSCIPTLPPILLRPG